MAAFIRLRVSHQQFILLLTLLLSLAQPLRVSAATAPLTTCICGAADRSAQALLAPQPGGSPGPIQLAQNTSLCLTTAKSAGGITCDGTCLFFDSCGPTSANFSVLTSGDHLVLQDANNASLCVDFNEVDRWRHDWGIHHSHLDARVQIPQKKNSRAMENFDSCRINKLSDFLHL